MISPVAVAVTIASATAATKNAYVTKAGLLYKQRVHRTYT